MRARVRRVAWIMIRRPMTKGGAAPEGGCDAGHVGEKARVGYTAEYEFYAAR